MLTEAALRVTGLVVAIVAVVWAALLALAEEAAVGEALHTLGDAPPIAAERRVPLHRALHVARLALLVLGAVATAHAVAWWTRPWAEALLTLVVGTLLLFIGGGAPPPRVGRNCPPLFPTALPLARPQPPPVLPLPFLLGLGDLPLASVLA